MANSLFDQTKYSLNYQKIRMVYQRPEIKASVEVILSVFSVAFLLLVAVRPTLSTVAELRKKIEDYQVVEKKLDNKISQLARAEEDLVDNSAYLYLFDQAVTDEPELAEIAKRIELIAVERDVILESLNFSRVDITGEEVIDEKKDEKDNYVEGEFSLRFSLSGTETNIMRFLREVEEMDRVAVLENALIKKVDEKDLPEGKLRATGILRGYYLESVLKEGE